MKIVSISDSHSYHRRVQVPDGDVFVCAGDITWRGEMDIFEDFCEWTAELPHKHKLFVPGNHELNLERSWERGPSLHLLKSYGIEYLEGAAIEIDGVKMFGSPYTCRYFDWAFNVDRGPAIAKKWAAIPDDTNVLITHGPPFGISDLVKPDPSQHRHTSSNQGCKDLAKRIENLPKLKAHIFGHIHIDHVYNPTAVRVIGDITFINASICNDAYNPINSARVIEI